MSEWVENWIEDMIYNLEDAEELEEQILLEYEKRGTRIKWQTAEGRNIAVAEMGDDHIFNARNLVHKNHPGSPWVEIFDREMERREMLNT